MVKAHKQKNASNNILLVFQINYCLLPVLGQLDFWPTETTDE